MSKTSRDFLTGVTRSRFIAVQHCLVPRSKTFDATQRTRSDALVNDLLAGQSDGNRFKLALFLFVIDMLAVMTGLTSFARLNGSKQKRIMDFLFDSPLALIRKGFWGLNALCKLGAYGQDCFYDVIGYRLKETPNV